MRADDSSSLRRLSRAAAERIRAHAWPGNVRQLENLIHALCVTCDTEIIEEHDLPDEIRGEGGAACGPLPELELPAMEKALIQRALERTAANRTQAARLLGVTRHVLLRKMKRHGID
ncbi:MAG: hypothetical protein E2P04_06825 [Acidobacteria bacterium]|nr:MAG: hypothetical protein E2P04_06825 [Acidobacteriota bacterium]